MSKQLHLSARAQCSMIAILIGILSLSLIPSASSASSTCDPNFSLTTEDVGQGRSCAIATSNLLFLLQGQYSCPAGTCVEELVITEPCQQHFGVAWTVWGYIRYKCNTGACASSQTSREAAGETAALTSHQPSSEGFSDHPSMDETTTRNAD